MPSFDRHKEAAWVCPLCDHMGITTFYEVAKIPVHSCLLMPTREMALAYPRRDLRLGYCEECGLAFNALFDLKVHEYGDGYEETQGFSPTFQERSRELIDQLIEEFGLRGKRVMEIGCGKGDFLYSLCKRGGNKGLGIDPAYLPGRLPKDAGEFADFERVFYQADHIEFEPDFIFCRHTLEHIAELRAFMRLIRDSIGPRKIDVWFDLPDATRVWNEGAFWDVYYEHAAYLTPKSLARLFRLSGFQVHELTNEYDGQWLSIIASTDPKRDQIISQLEMDDVAMDAGHAMNMFEQNARMKIDSWNQKLKQASADAKRVILWGGGSKAVAFLTTLDMSDAIDYVVDINPHKSGKFMPGTGHPVVAPSHLKSHPPDLVIVMNPIYLTEIQGEVQSLGIECELLACC